MTLSLKITNQSTERTAVVVNATGHRDVLAPGESVTVSAWVGGDVRIIEEVGGGVAVDEQETPADGTAVAALPPTEDAGA